jgi:hypothetical protein
MPDLDFKVQGVEAQQFSVTPLLNFKLKLDQVADADALSIHAIALRCQIRIEPARRRYTADQQESLRELFGPSSQWGQTLRPMLWTHASTVVSAFTGSTTADLPVPCTYDFNLAITKYFDAVGSDGEIPLCFLFSGTVFYESKTNALQAAPISWEKEAYFRLPANIWREVMDLHYPNCAYVSLSKDLFDRLRQFKLHNGHFSLDQSIEELLQGVEQKVPR